MVWQRDTDIGCPDEDSGTATGNIVGEITGLQEDSSYSITVRAINDAGNSSEITVIAMTLEAGMLPMLYLYLTCTSWFISCSAI